MTQGRTAGWLAAALAAKSSAVRGIPASLDCCCPSMAASERHVTYAVVSAAAASRHLRCRQHSAAAASRHVRCRQHSGAASRHVRCRQQSRGAASCWTILTARRSRTRDVCVTSPERAREHRKQDRQRLINSAACAGVNSSFDTDSVQDNEKNKHVHDCVQGHHARISCTSTL